MNIYLHSDVDAEKIMRNRGLGENGLVAKFMASEVKRFCDPYVPMSAGAGAHMKNRAKIAGGGKRLIYPGPYAHYHWVGELMAGTAPKHYTGIAMNYHGAPMRGPHWEKRMMADHKEDLEGSVETYIKGMTK